LTLRRFLEPLVCIVTLEDGGGEDRTDMDEHCDFNFGFGVVVISVLLLVPLFLLVSLEVVSFAFAPEDSLGRVVSAFVLLVEGFGWRPLLLLFSFLTSAITVYCFHPSKIGREREEIRVGRLLALGLGLFTPDF